MGVGTGSQGRHHQRGEKHGVRGHTLQSWEASSTKVSRVLTSSSDEACPVSCTVSMVCSPMRTAPTRPPGADAAEARMEERLVEASFTTWITVER